MGNHLRIENALLMSQAGAEPVRAAVLEARDGAITYAGPAAGCPLTGSPTLLDAAGMLLMPGFVNAHTHAAMVLFRGVADDMPLKPWLEERIWPMEARLTAEDVYWGTLLGCAEMLLSGVTCFCDMYHHFEAATQAAVAAGIRVLPSGVLLGTTGDADRRLAAAVDFCCDLQAQAIPTVHPMLGPHAPYTCSDSLLVSAREAAADLGVGLHIHLSETRQEVSESIAAHGVSPVRRLADLGLLGPWLTAAHCVHLGHEDLALLATHRVGVAHCPTSNMKLASGFAPVPDLLAAGVPTGLGTDGAASNNNLDMIEEARLAALIHKGHRGDSTAVPAQAALRMATLGSAEAVGLGAVVGSLEVGKRADCILMDLGGAHNQPLCDVPSQIVYAAHTHDVHTVIVEGEVLVQSRELVRLDLAEAIAETTARSRRIAACIR